MDNVDRINNYVKQLKNKTVDGFFRLTPKQRRRVLHKQGHMIRKAESKE